MTQDIETAAREASEAAALFVEGFPWPNYIRHVDVARCLDAFLASRIETLLDLSEEAVTVACDAANDAAADYEEFCSDAMVRAALRAYHLKVLGR